MISIFLFLWCICVSCCNMSVSVEITLQGLIAKIRAASDHARSNGTPNDHVLIGELLWHQVVAENPTQAEQEAVVAKYTKTITSAVEGFSDYADCFGEISHFLELAIANLSTVVALGCAKVGVVLYGTENGSHNYSAGWAEAAITRCTQWLTVDTAGGFSDEDIVNIAGACRVLKTVGDAGDEYRELLQNNEELHETLAATLGLAESSPRATVFARVNLQKIGPIVQLLREVTALCSSSLDDVLSNLESAVNLDKPKSWSGDVLLEAYNAMCEEQPDDLSRQLKAAQGPLGKMAVRVLQTLNEEKQGKKELFMEAAVFVKLLLVPWAREDLEHMAVKQQIATILKDLGLVEALLQQFTFWVTNWNSMYADCGTPVFVALYELMRYFPELVNEVVLPHEHAVALIRKTAASQGVPGRINFGGATYESAGSVSLKMVCLLDGKELPAEQPAAAPAGGFGFSF